MTIKQSRPEPASLLHRRKSCGSVAIIIFLFISLLVLVCAILLALPGHVDKFLLTDSNYCCLDERASDRRINVNGLKNNDGYDDKYDVKPQKEVKLSQSETRRGLIHRVVDSLAWNVLILNFKKNHKQETDDDDDNGNACPLNKVGNYDVLECQNMHPVCEKYRTLRAQLRAHKLILPWNWYYKTRFKLNGLSLHDLTESIQFVHKTDEATWRMTTIVRRFAQSLLFTDSHSYDVAQIDFTPSSKESASLHVESADISFQSWKKPIVSAHLNQITINIIIQKGSDDIGVKLLVGDMTVPEFLRILPKPPNLEGLYPRIGVINITNVTLNVYEGRVGTPFNLFHQVHLPDKLFFPVTNLTLAHSPGGIDRKHFQPLLESAFSQSIRQHLIREAEKAFQNSLTTKSEFSKQLKDLSYRAQEQLHQYVLMTQDLHFDRWWGIIVQGFHQTQERIWHGMIDGTVPILTAFGDLIEDIKKTPPLALLVSYHWTKLVNGIDKNVAPIDQQVWRHIHDLALAFDGLVARATGADVDHAKYSVPIEKRIANRLDKLKDSFDDLVTKSGGNIERLLQSCEDEMKDKWMDWHKQFFPEL